MPLGPGFICSLGSLVLLLLFHETLTKIIIGDTSVTVLNKEINPSLFFYKGQIVGEGTLHL